MKHYTPTGLSLPTDLMHKIDCDRGDISRSRYLLRIIEKIYATERQEAQLRDRRIRNNDTGLF